LKNLDGDTTSRKIESDTMAFPDGYPILYCGYYPCNKEGITGKNNATREFYETRGQPEKWLGKRDFYFKIMVRYVERMPRNYKTHP
jgi:hypothetical protein